MYILICIYRYMYMLVYIYIYIYIALHSQRRPVTGIHLYITCVHVYRYMYIFVYVCIHCTPLSYTLHSTNSSCDTHRYMYCVHTYRYMYIWYMHICIARETEREKEGERIIWRGSGRTQICDDLFLSSPVEIRAKDVSFVFKKQISQARPPPPTWESISKAHTNCETVCFNKKFSILIVAY